MKITHIFLFLFISLLGSLSLSAQADAPLSPAKEVKGTLAYGQNFEVHYSAPSVRGRKIWGELVPYGEVWRTGANEATTFEIDRDVKVNGQNLPAGKYALFTIPGEKEWTLIFNKDWKQMGTSKYSAKKDALRITVPSTNAGYLTEQMNIDVSDQLLTLRWEYLMVFVTLE